MTASLCVFDFVCMCVFRYQGRREETNMVIINIKLLSGYILDKSSLKLVSSAVLNMSRQGLIHHTDEIIVKNIIICYNLL